MPTKAQAFAQLAEDTATHLTSSLANWTGFLPPWGGCINTLTMNSL